MIDRIIMEKKIKGEPIDPFLKRINLLEGKAPPKQKISYRYVDALTDAEYLCVAGGLAWPGSRPGFCLVMAASEPRKDVIQYHVLEEAERESVWPLLDDAYRMYLKYGHGLKVIPWQFYGDPESGYAEALRKFNEKLDKQGKPQIPFLTYPAHYADTNKMAIYARTIHDVTMTPGRLHLHGNDRISKYLELFQQIDMETAKPQEYPAIAALGYALTWLHEYEPWVLVDGEEEFPTLQTFEEYARKSFAEGEKELYQTLDAMGRHEGEDVDEILETVL